MSKFFKDNAMPVIISVLIGLSSYLLERTVSHEVQLQQLQQELKEIKVSIRELTKLMIKEKQ